jgi:hypothetical protein
VLSLLIHTIPHTDRDNQLWSLTLIFSLYESKDLINFVGPFCYTLFLFNFGVVILLLSALPLEPPLSFAIPLSLPTYTAAVVDPTSPAEYSAISTIPLVRSS